MTDRGHIHRPGEDPLAPRPMTRQQVENPVRLVRRRQAGGSDATARAQRERWAQWRAERGRK